MTLKLTPRKFKPVEKEIKDAYDLADIKTMITDDIDEKIDNGALPDCDYKVTLKLKKRGNNEICIRGFPNEYHDTLLSICKQYVQPEWRDYWQHWGINFVPVIKS